MYRMKDEKTVELPSLKCAKGRRRQLQNLGSYWPSWALSPTLQRSGAPANSELSWKEIERKWLTQQWNVLSRCLLGSSRFPSSTGTLDRQGHLPKSAAGCKDLDRPWAPREPHISILWITLGALIWYSGAAGTKPLAKPWMQPGCLSRSPPPCLVAPGTHPAKWKPGLPLWDNKIWTAIHITSDNLKSQYWINIDLFLPPFGGPNVGNI